MHTHFNHKTVPMVVIYLCQCLLFIQIDISKSFPSPSGACLAGTPYSDEYDYHERVFVVAEHDDTYVYHLHLGETDFLPLSVLLPSVLPPSFLSIFLSLPPSLLLSPSLLPFLTSFLPVPPSL